MTFNPKVSIIVPLYNCEKYIEECIDSIYAQTYKNIEVICIDNESTDSSYEAIKKLKEEKYSDLIIGSAPNIYPLCWEESRDKGLEIMSGEYCMVMASDDYLEKQFIEKYINIFSKSPNKILALQSGIMGIQNGKNVGVVKYYYKNLDEMKRELLKKCVVNTPTVMYNKRLYETGLLKTRPDLYSGAADYDMYFNLVNADVMIYPVPDWLGYYYRWHENQATWQMHKSSVRYDLLIQEKWKNKWKLA